MRMGEHAPLHAIATQGASHQRNLLCVVYIFLNALDDEVRWLLSEFLWQERRQE